MQNGTGMIGTHPVSVSSKQYTLVETSYKKAMYWLRPF